MNASFAKVYDLLPSAGRHVAASLYGLWLRRERYGPETDGLVAAALERESWSSERWKLWEEERLAFVLHRAATRVPYYRDLWSRRRAGGDRRSVEQIENWPVLEKCTVREMGRAFVADDQAGLRMAVERTSGTSGAPLTLWRSRRTTRARYALYEARRLRWYGVSREHRWAILGGRVVTPYVRRRPPFWVWNAALRQIYLSSYHLAPEFVPVYLDALRRYRVRHVIGYPSSLFAIARTIGAGGAADLGIRVIVTNAEPLFAHQREAIEAAFRCPVRETYGMVELVAGAGECEQGNPHLWPEMGRCEVQQHDGPVSRQGAGELIATSLLDADMPLIRYRTGDRVELAGPDSSCACGRALPLLRAVEGRCDDLVYSRDGRPVGRLDPVFKAGLRVTEAQIVQESLCLVRVRVVPNEGFGESDAREIRRALRERLGDVQVVVERAAAIQRSSNGKFPAVISSVEPAEENVVPRVVAA